MKIARGLPSRVAGMIAPIRQDCERALQRFQQFV
jgi:hypothetical protein